MDSLTVTLAAFAAQHAILSYLAIYLVTIFGGTVAAFIAFWLGLSGIFPGWHFVFLFLIIFAALATGDCLWYLAGRSLKNTHFGEWVKHHIPGHAKTEALLERRGKHLLYISKLAYGSAGPVMFMLGWTGMPFGQFLRNALFSVAIMLGIIFGIAYGLFSGFSPLAALTTFKHIELLFLAACLIFFLAEYGLAKIIKRLLSSSS